MASKISLLCSFFCLITFFLEAQTAGYFVESRFLQRLVWVKDDYARRYEVVIEREENETHRQHLREFTNENFIIVSLSPGKYRYRVIPYDFLDRPRQTSQWMNIEIMPLLDPRVEDISPSVLYPREDAVHTITVTGTNISPDAKIYLRRLGGDTVIPIEINIGEDGTSAELQFENSRFTSGEYEIVIINPGGQETSSAGIVFDPKPEHSPSGFFGALQPRFAAYITAAWIPLLPVYGEDFGLDFLVSPCAAIRFGIVSVNLNPINAGLELTAGWYTFETLINSEDAAYNTLMLELNLITKKPLTNQAMAVCFRLGAGFSFMLDAEAPELRDKINVNMGVSFQWLILKPLSFELGLDYAHLFKESPSGAFRPWFSLGLQF